MSLFNLLSQSQVVQCTIYGQTTSPDEEIAVIANCVLRNCKKVGVDWRKEFPAAGLPPAPAVLDTFNDLMKLNPGKVYKQLEKEDKGRTKFGLVPAMASGSKGCLGFLPAASFCERCNSVAKDVMTDAHCLMGKESLEILVVLRMNRKFMQYMRTKYSGLTQQQFGLTLVDLVEDASNSKYYGLGLTL